MCSCEPVCGFTCLHAQCCVCQHIHLSPSIKEPWVSLACTPLSLQVDCSVCTPPHCPGPTGVHTCVLGSRVHEPTYLSTHLSDMPSHEHFYVTPPSVTSEMSQDGSIYTMGIGRCYTSGLFFSGHLLMYHGDPGAPVPHLTICTHIPVHVHVCLSTCTSVDTHDLCVPACLCLCTHVRPSAAFLFGSWFHRKLLGWGRGC